MWWNLMCLRMISVNWISDVELCCELVAINVYCNYYLSRLKQPEYQYFREIVGAAKTFEQLEKSTVDMKTLLMVRHLN